MAAGGCGVVHPPSPPCLIQSLQSREVKSGPWVGRYLESGVVLGVVVCQVLLLFFEFDEQSGHFHLVTFGCYQGKAYLRTAFGRSLFKRSLETMRGSV